MSTPRETFEAARAGGRLPLSAVAGIAWLESSWNPAARTGRHVGLFQLVDSEQGSIYGDWLAAGGPRVPSLEDPDANATIAGWGLARAAQAVRAAVRPVELADKELWPLVYWAWLAGTSDVPRLVRAYAGWLARDETTSRIPLKRIVEELQERLTTRGQLWRRYQQFERAEKWRPERIRQASLAGAFEAPGLVAEYWLDEGKARHAERLRPWIGRTWEEILKVVTPEFQRRYGRSPLESWLRGAGWGALIAALLIGYAALKR